MTADRDLLTGLLDALPGRPDEGSEEPLLDLPRVDDRDLALALAIRTGRRFEGLRDARLDPRLFLYLPLALAQRERVVPLALTGECLTVAAASLDPDLSWVRGRFPSLRVELLVAPRDEILTALEQVVT